MKAKNTVVSLIPIEDLLSEYDSLRSKKKLIDERMKYLAEQIKENASTVGVKDDKGSYYAESNNYVYGKQAKKSVSFNRDKALDYFKAHNFRDCIEIVESINEDAVETRINTGDISYEDLENITITKVTYAIDIKKKEEMPEIMETKVASKKPKIVLKGGKR